MDDFVSLFYPRTEMLHIFFDIYCRSLRKDFVVIVFLINLFRCDRDIVQIVLSVQVDVERKIIYVITLFYFFVEVACAVGT